MKIISSFALFFIVIVGHAQSDKEKVISTLTDMWNAIETGDLERYASHLHPDYSYFGESDAYLTEGKKADVKSTGRFIARSENFHTDMHQPSVTIVGDVAWITYYWSDYGLIDEKKYSSRGKSTRIFVKENGKWLCIHGHFTQVD